MKIKAYDKYNKQWVIISFPDDEMSCDWADSDGCNYFSVQMCAEAIEGDKWSCEVKRWSDLEQFKIIE